jgi:hypothetical protein
VLVVTDGEPNTSSHKYVIITELMASQLSVVSADVSPVFDTVLHHHERRGSSPMVKLGRF